MLFFGHTGITVGVAELLGRAPRGRAGQRAEGGAPGVAERAARESGRRGGPRIDYRLVLVGALLPDIVDKPTGMAIFGDIFANGRIFGHTLAFALLLWVAGAYLHRRGGQSWLLVLAYGVTMHLVLDEMWSNPRTLLWPLQGWSFARGGVTTLSEALAQWIHSLLTDPRVYISELAGGLLLARLLFRAARRGELALFVKRGWIG